MEITVKCCPDCKPPYKVTLQSNGRYKCEKCDHEFSEAQLIEAKIEDCSQSLQKTTESSSLKALRTEWRESEPESDDVEQQQRQHRGRRR